MDEERHMSDVINEKLDQIIAMLEKLVPKEEEPEVCDHTMQGFVSRDGWFRCEHCNVRLVKDR